MAALCQVMYILKEEVNVGTLIGTILTDAKLDLKYSPDVVSSLRFRFLTPPLDFLSIDELTGRLTTQRRIDRDAICRNEDVCRIQQDVAIQPIQYFDIIKVSIDIVDINDNEPEFIPNQLIQEMMESASVGTGFVIPAASDPDTRPFSITGYRLVVEDKESEKFELRVVTKMDGSTEVRLMLIEGLDREQRDLHTVKVVAYDGGSPSRNGTLEVSIVVLDANDNFPTFDYGSYETKLKENVPAMTFVIRVVAHDSDAGLNGEVSYGFGASTKTNFGQIFEINNRSGEIFVIGEVDHEQNPVCHLIVMAVDRGVEQMQSETAVVVTIEDVNDNPPSITVNTLYDADTDVAQISENVEVGTFVGHVIGRDPDKGDNGKFNCSVENDGKGSYFRLRRMFNGEYHVVTSGLIDREKNVSFRLTISCQDSGDPVLISQKHLVVDVLDLNDNPPTFTKSVYQTEIAENVPTGFPVFQVRATDPDVGMNKNITYSLVGSNSTHFAIDPRTGAISPSANFDYENKKEFRLKVSAMDGGSPKLSGFATVIFRITDVNDEVPVFTNDTYLFEIFEHRHPGTEVGMVSASDADTFPHNRFRFQLVSSDHEKSLDAFRLDQISGMLISAVELDREERSVHQLIVVVRDEEVPSFVSTATVVVRVRDNNDNRPKFLFPNFHNHTVILTEPVVRGQLVAVVSAIDADSGPNADIRYSIAKETRFHRMFTIHPRSGALIANENIYATSVAENRTISVTLSATDNGYPAVLQSLANLHVIVKKPEVAGSRVSFLYGNITLTDQNLPLTVIICLVTAVIIIGLSSAIVVLGCRRAPEVDEANKDTEKKTIKATCKVAGNCTIGSLDSNGFSKDKQTGTGSTKAENNNAKNTQRYLGVSLIDGIPQCKVISWTE